MQSSGQVNQLVRMNKWAMHVRMVYKYCAHYTHNYAQNILSLLFPVMGMYIEQSVSPAKTRSGDSDRLLLIISYALLHFYLITFAA